MEDLKIYTVPEKVTFYSDYAVRINGQPIGLYGANVLYPPFLDMKKVPYGYFDFKNEVKVEITVPYKVECVDIRPKSLNIDADIIGNTVMFKVSKQCQLSVEFNGSIENTIHLFANNMISKPAFCDNDIIYYPAGIHEIGTLQLKDNQTVYIDGGAYVYGKIQADNVKNIKISGRGILSAENVERIERFDRRCVDIIGCENVQIDGIIIHDSATWTVRIMDCDNVDINNIKIFGWRGNSDGIDICGARNVEAKNCFIRNWDDSLVVKGFDTGDIYNVKFSNIIIWNDFARPIEIGYENRADNIHDIYFENIDVIHALSGYPVLGIHQGDRARIKDIFFEDIRIEDAKNCQIFDLRIKPSAWNDGEDIGSISNVYFKNIYLNGDNGIERIPENSRIEGYSAKSNIEDIYFENIYLLGKKATSPYDCYLDIKDFASKIHFIGETDDKIEHVKSKLNIIEEQRIDGANKLLKIEVTLINKESTPQQGRMWIEITPSYRIVEQWDYNLAPNEVVVKIFEIKVGVGKNLIMAQSDKIGFHTDYVLYDCEYNLVVIQSKEQIHTVPALKLQDIGTLKMANFNQCLYIVADIADDCANQRINYNLKYRGMMLQNEPLKKSCISIYVSQRAEPVDDEILFLIPETLYGTSTSLVQKNGKPVVASEIRNICEVTFVFENQPKVDDILNLQFEPVVTENGVSHYEIQLPLKELEKLIFGDYFHLEILANTVLANENKYNLIPLFHSLRPNECCQMYGRVNLQEV